MQPQPDRAIPLLLVDPDGLADALATLPAVQADWARAMGFAAGLGEVVALPGEGGVAHVLVGLGTDAARSRERFGTARAASRLPIGTYAIEGEPVASTAREMALGWLLEGYRFDRYRKNPRPAGPVLQAPAAVDMPLVEALAAAEVLTRTLIDTPASDMGPADLEAAARNLAQAHGARIDVTTGDDLLAANLPMIHAVGRAAAPGREPRLIDFAWGETGPLLTLVGKGVCFDTGGLDLKPASSMALMKKDMGGAATVLGLAQAIMARGLPLRLRVLIPAVENAVGPDAMRPGDILHSRKGLSVEINNTDAEGRLVLADALALAAEEKPDLLVSYATLTGAARVALGPDLAPFFTDDEALAAALSRGGAEWFDPVWRLPFHAPYEAMIEPGIADLDNAPSGGMAGAVTAALFLRRFATGETGGRYLHLDIFGWQPVAAPGRPKGGAGQGARALFAALPEVLGL